MDKKEILISLKSGNDTKAIQAIGFIREHGDNEILKECLNLLENSVNEDIHKEISSILNDIKNQNSASVITEHISSTENSAVKKILVSSCWQSSLNYSDYIDIFVDVLTNSDYETTIEAFSLIEKLIDDDEVSIQKISEIRDKVAESVISIPSEIQPLIMEFIKDLDQRLNN